MILGMSLSTFTFLHVVISLVGIASGLIVVYGFITGKRLDSWTAFFLLTYLACRPIPPPLLANPSRSCCIPR